METQEFEINSASSKVNSGWLINLMLNNLWKDAHKHSRAGMYSDWNADLDCIWTELAGEYEEESKEIVEYDDLSIQLLNVINWGSAKDFNKHPEMNKIERTRQYNILRKKERFLKRVQNLQGKGTAYRENADDYFDQ